MIALLFPKPVKRPTKPRKLIRRRKPVPKPKEPLRRSRKPIAARFVFKAFDPLGRRSKRYRSDAEV
jgi:hypothetical protein